MKSLDFTFILTTLVGYLEVNKGSHRYLVGVDMKILRILNNIYEAF